MCTDNEDDTKVVLVSEFGGGGTLAQTIIRHKKERTLVEEDSLWQWAISLLNGISELHNRGITHGG